VDTEEYSRVGRGNENCSTWSKEGNYHTLDTWWEKMEIVWERNHARH